MLQDLHLLDGMVERYCHHGKRLLFLENENLDILFIYTTSFLFDDKKDCFKVKITIITATFSIDESATTSAVTSGATTVSSGKLLFFIPTQIK